MLSSPLPVLTLSSPAATLKASSTRQPTAMRTALEECISFHTVSLSTCRGRRAGFSVPPAGGGQEWGWALGQPAAMLGRKGGAKIGRTIHQPTLAGALLTPIPPQGSMAYIFWLMGPAGKRNRAILEVASTVNAVGGGVQRAVSSVREKDPSPRQASAAHTSWEMSVPCSGGASCLWGRQKGERGRIIWEEEQNTPPSPSQTPHLPLCNALPPACSDNVIFYTNRVPWRYAI